MSCLLQTFDANEVGRDFVVGDIHGCFTMLDALLARIGFDAQRDRLFSVGDLIDRGPDSERALDALDAPWFHAIRGNHEQMLLDAVDGAGQARELWRLNGGGWFDGLESDVQQTFAERIATLPYAAEITLADGGIAVLVHADVLDNSWPATRDVLQQPADRVDERRLAPLLWDRNRVHALQERGAPVAVAGVDLIAFGHTPMNAAIACANTRWLDTGAVFGNRLSVAELAVNGEVWSLATDMQDCRTGWQTV